MMKLLLDTALLPPGPGGGRAVAGAGYVRSMPKLVCAVFTFETAEARETSDPAALSKRLCMGYSERFAGCVRLVWGVRANRVPSFSYDSKSPFQRMRLNRTAKSVAIMDLAVLLFAECYL